MADPVFDPSKPFEEAKPPSTPVFDPNKPFEEVSAEASPKKHGAALDWSEVPLEAVKNIPSSALQFGKNVVQPFIHPIDTAKSLGELGGGVLQHLGLMSGEEHKPAADAVGKFLMDRYGSINAIKETLANDPVGLAGDLSMILSGGGTAAARLPGVVGRVGEIASAAGRYTNPLTPVAAAAAPVARAVGRTAAEALGVTTGVGAQPIIKAAEAGYEGGAPARAFREHITGEAPIAEPVSDAQAAMAQLRNERGVAYRDAMAQLGRTQTQPLNFNLVDRALQQSTNVHTYKGVPLDPPNVSDIRIKIAQAIQKWKMLPPDRYHTAEGLDALKKQIGGIRDSTDFGTPERVVANQAYNALRQTIVNAAPEYARIMKGYEQASTRLDELQKELSIPTPDRGRIDTSLRKLQSVLRNNVNTSFGRRQELAQYLADNGAPDLMYKLAGQALQPWSPRGLSRYTLSIGEAMLGILGLGGHVATGTALPAAVAGAAAASPRLVGEGAFWGGVGARKIAPIVPRRAAFPPAAATGEITNAAQQPAPRQTGGGVPAIGGTGGRSPGAREIARARAPRQGTSQALQDGGAARDQAGPAIKPGTREHWAALIMGSPSSSGLARGKAPAGVSRNDIVEMLRRRGLSGEALGSFKDYSPESYQEGGEVESKNPWESAYVDRSWRRDPGIHGHKDPRSAILDPFPEELGARTQYSTPSYDPQSWVNSRMGGGGTWGERRLQEGGAVEDKAGGFEEAAARVRRRYPVREPDPASLAASQGKVTFADVARGRASALTSLPERATRAAGELQRTGDVYDPGPALEAARLVMGGTGFGAPAGAVGAGAVVRRRPAPVAAPTVMPERALFDYSRLREVPDVPQVNLPRYEPPRGVPESAQELATRANLARINRVVQRGAEQGGLEWYNTMPLREAFIAELGPERGPIAFGRYMDMVASTSPRSTVPVNVRNASFYYGLGQRGEPLPPLMRVGNNWTPVQPLPSPYGHIAQALHVQNARNVLEQGGIPVFQNPKPASFSQNLQGNWMPVTIDAHNARLIGLGRDKPFASEYGFLEAMQQREAARLGMTPAQYQASAWIGGGEQTGLKSSADPFLRAFDQRVRFTADQRGLPPETVLRQFIRGEAPLLNTGGAV